MANTKISALPAGTTPAGTEVIPAVQSGATVGLTVSQIRGSSSGTVTSVSVVTANGVSGTVATATSTPAITLALGAITPTSVAATGAVSGATVAATTPIAVASGGTGTTTPALVAGTNITSITGTWPNQTINAAAGTFTGGTLTSALNDAPTVTVAGLSSATPIGAAASSNVVLSGTTTQNSFDTIAAGAVRRIRFSGVMTLVNGTALILPTGANITTAVDDTAEVLSLGSGNWFFLHYFRKSGSALASSGGLTDFTDALSSTAPNATVPVASLTATNAATNVDFVVGPKGTGSILGKIPDGTTTGGNKRGVTAVDLQLDLNAGAANVASGTSSVLIGGSGNQATNTKAGVFAGQNNIASGTQAVVLGSNGSTASSNTGAVLGGTSNVASTGTGAVVIGGTTSTASGTGATVIGGTNCLADGDFSVAIGGRASARGMVGAIAFASSPSTSFSVGARQVRWATLQADTTTATTKAMTVDGGAVSSINQLKLVSTCVMKVTGQVVVRDGSGNAGWWDITGACKNVAGTVTTLGTATISAFQGDAALNACALALAADNTNKCLQVNVTGIAATTLIWLGDFRAIEAVS